MVMMVVAVVVVVVVMEAVMMVSGGLVVMVLVVPVSVSVVSPVLDEHYKRPKVCLRSAKWKLSKGRPRVL
jgi:hypothetical protein